MGILEAHRKVIALFQFKFSPPPQSISIENATGAQIPQIYKVSPLLAGDSCPHRAIHSRALTFCKMKSIQKDAGCGFSAPLKSLFSARFLSPGFAGLPGKHSVCAQPVLVRTSRSSPSTSDAEEETSRSREGNAAFIPPVKRDHAEHQQN